MTEYDPRLVAPTCLYLASKAEESTVQARLLVFYIKKLCKMLTYNFIFLHVFEILLILDCLSMLKRHILYADADEKYRYEIKDILEMEMKVLEALNYYLVVYHPYRSLSP